VHYERLPTLHVCVHVSQNMMRLKQQLAKLGLNSRGRVRRDNSVDLLAGLGAFAAVSVMTW
jgi:hypothetical protein